MYKAWPAAKQPRHERMSRACKVVGGAQGCVPWGANGEMLCTSSRSGVQEIMRTIVAVAVRIILREARESKEGRLNE